MSIKLNDINQNKNYFPIIYSSGEQKEITFDEKIDQSYPQLKMEVKQLANLTGISLLCMAQRLLIIRDKKLYQKDNYPNFKTFIENELRITKRTVYTYMDLILHFGVKTFSLHPDIEHSKLIPAIPLLKSKINSIPKEEIRKKYIELSKHKSARELKKIANEDKKKYQLIKVSDKFSKNEEAIIMKDECVYINKKKVIEFKELMPQYQEAIFKYLKRIYGSYHSLINSNYSGINAAQ